MMTDQDSKLEIIPSQHPVDAIVRAIVAGAEFARRVFDQTKDYEIPPDKEDRENFRSALKVISTCISETQRLREGLLEGWENRNGKPSIVMAAQFDVDPRIQARTTIPTPDFEFPGPWIRFEISEAEMQHQIVEEGEVLLFEPQMVDADVEVVSNDTKDPEAKACCVRALNSEGLKWIMKRPEIVEKASKIE